MGDLALAVGIVLMGLLAAAWGVGLAVLALGMTGVLRPSAGAAAVIRDAVRAPMLPAAALLLALGAADVPTRQVVLRAAESVNAMIWPPEPVPRFAGDAVDIEYDQPLVEMARHVADFLTRNGASIVTMKHAERPIAANEIRYNEAFDRRRALRIVMALDGIVELTPEGENRSMMIVEDRTFDIRLGRARRAPTLH